MYTVYMVLNPVKLPMDIISVWPISLYFVSVGWMLRHALCIMDLLCIHVAYNLWKSCALWQLADYNNYVIFQYMMLLYWCKHLDAKIKGYLPNYKLRSKWYILFLIWLCKQNHFLTSKQMTKSDWILWRQLTNHKLNIDLNPPPVK